VTSVQILLNIVVPAAIAVSAVEGFRRWRNAWSLFLAGFALCWLLQGLFRLVWP
jgi:hypothetical protein